MCMRERERETETERQRDRDRDRDRDRKDGKGGKVYETLELIALVHDTIIVVSCGL